MKQEKMAQISVEVSEAMKEELAERADYPDQRLSDVVRDAFEVYLQIENPEELIDESDSE